MAKRPFIIWTPSFDENTGGPIALHFFCHMLNELGERAYLWPSRRASIIQNVPAGNYLKIRHLFYSTKSRIRNIFANRTFKTSEHLISNVADQAVLKEAIVVYPEIVAGNPLDSSRIVRWFLHKPGHHTNVINYGPNELYFFIHSFFNNPNINPDETNLLRLRWIMSDIYKNKNSRDRNGSCYLIRKGAHRIDINIPENSTCIDGLSHERISKIFNRTKYFFCYDPYTMYCIYAAMCGCIPIVMPEGDLTKEQWRPNASDRLGIAYGLNDEAWAVETRDHLLHKLDNEKLQEKEMVRSFIVKCENYFRES